MYSPQMQVQQCITRPQPVRPRFTPPASTLSPSFSRDLKSIKIAQFDSSKILENGRWYFFSVTSSLGKRNIIETGETLLQLVSQRCAHFAICMTFCHKHVFAVYSISHRVNLFLFLSWFPLSWWWYSKSAQPPWQNSTLQSSQTLTKKYQATFKV